MDHCCNGLNISCSLMCIVILDLQGDILVGRYVGVSEEYHRNHFSVNQYLVDLSEIFIT